MLWDFMNYNRIKTLFFHEYLLICSMNSFYSSEGSA